jgi:hypothetical protein
MSVGASCAVSAKKNRVLASSAAMVHIRRPYVTPFRVLNLSMLILIAAPVTTGVIPDIVA